MGSVKKKLKKSLKFGINYEKNLLNLNYLESLDENDIIKYDNIIIFKSIKNPLLDNNGKFYGLENNISIKCFGNSLNSSVYLQKIKTNNKYIIKKVYCYKKKLQAEMDISVLVNMDNYGLYPRIYAIHLNEFTIDIYIQKIEFSLQSYCNDNELSLFQLRCIFKDVLRGIEILHKEGIVHEDIKADNILIERYTRGGKNSFKGYLTDFGLSQYQYYRKINYENGNILTSSPEKINCKGEKCNNKLDIWSVGICYLQAKLRTNLIYPLREANRFNYLLHIGRLRNFPSEIVYETLEKYRHNNEPSKSPILSYFPKFQTLDQMEIEFFKATLAVDPCKRMSANEILKLKLFLSIDDL